MKKNQINPTEAIIRPQWITVKEEILSDFFELTNNFSNWMIKPKNSHFFDLSVASLIALYLKVRLKMKEKSSFKSLSGEIDNYIQNPQSATYRDIMRFTMSLCEYIESTGITAVEEDKRDPIDDFIYQGFPQ